MKQVTLVELNVFEAMVPLVSGYLESYACLHPEISSTHQFNKYTQTIKTPLSVLVQELIDQQSDIYTFSCYLWNMKLMQSLLSALIKMIPNAHFLLGGPQVMHHARDYLDPDFPQMLVCNGEGEKTFTNFLLELLNPRPDFNNVRGLSFYQDGTLITTEPEPRIADLNEIPSPFLNGVFEGNYRMSILETNRGCPFRCGFCFWGAATNDRVYKFDEQRVRQEVEWLSSNGTPFLFIADANWGMLKRDIELSRHIAECQEKFGLPVYVYFSAAKNSPGRVAEITEIFTKAGLINAQPISMQSLDETSLDLIDRKNIRLSAFEELQQDLNQREISSFIELIWPLPGETLSSFKQGIENLFERKASIIVVYSHLLLHNTPLYEKRDEFGLVTRIVDDGAAEAELVVETADVNYQEFMDGMWFYYAVLALHNTRSLQHLGEYLHTSESMAYNELYTAFVDFCKANMHYAFSKFCHESIEEARYYDVSNYPMVYHINLHTHRDQFDELLFRFASSQSWWGDQRARVLFELDMINKPYVYSNTPFGKPKMPFEHIKVLDIESRNFLVEVPDEYLPLPGLDTPGEARENDRSHQFRVDHKRIQHPHLPDQNWRDKADYCYGIIMRVGQILPDWTRHSLQEVY